MNINFDANNKQNGFDIKMSAFEGMLFLWALLDYANNEKNPEDDRQLAMHMYEELKAEWEK